MFEFFIGIIIGATFAEFWRDLYKAARVKFETWSADHKSQKVKTDNQSAE